MKNLIISSIRKRKVQAFSVVLATATCVAVLFALMLLYSGVQKGMELSEARGGAEVMVIPPLAESEISDRTLLFTGAPDAVYMTKDVYEEVLKVEGVEAATAQFFAQTIDEDCCSTSEPSRVVGLDPETDWTVQPLTEYDLSQGLADDEIIVGDDIKTEGQVYILGRVFTVVGRLERMGSDVDNTMYVSMNTARELALENEANAPLWEEKGQPEQLISAVLVKIDPSLSGEDRERVIRHLGYVDYARAIERSDIMEDAQQSLSEVFGIMLLAGGLMLVVCLVQLLARFYQMAWDRKSELALYRAVGASKSDLAVLIAGEAGALGAGGVVMGLLAGMGLYLGIQGWLAGFEAFPFVAPGVVQIVLFALAILVVFALLLLVSIAAPLRQIGRIDPSLAMQQSDID